MRIFGFTMDPTYNALTFNVREDGGKIGMGMNIEYAVLNNFGIWVVIAFLIEAYQKGIRTMREDEGAGA